MPLVKLTASPRPSLQAMDVPDTFLALSKALSYMGIEAITMPVFAIFMGTLRAGAAKRLLSVAQV